MSKPPKKPQVERDIDENLRRVYQRMVQREIPQRFLELLDSLERTEQDSGAGK